MSNKFKRGDKVRFIGYYDNTPTSSSFMEDPPNEIQDAITEQRVFTIAKGTPDGDGMIRIVEEVDHQKEFFPEELVFAEIKSWREQLTGQSDGG